jgi:predicted nucleic acid-binding protein
VATPYSPRRAPSFAGNSGPRNTVDGLIAATARVHGLTVVTRNTGDFEGCGVPLLNPWQPESGTFG